MPRTFLYRCPNTGQNVQGWSADEVTDDDDTYGCYIPKIMSFCALWLSTIFVRSSHNRQKWTITG